MYMSETIQNNSISLDQLKFNQKATACEVNSERSDVQCRLLTLGLYTGVKLEVLRQAPLGDPLQVRSGSTLLSIRRSEAKAILVKPIEEKLD